MGDKTDGSLAKQGPQLVVTGIRKAYELSAGPALVLDDVSLTVSPGETVAVVGPSGSGKSTLLNIIGSLDRPSAGSVRLGTLEVTKLTDTQLAEYRSNQVGFVFQDHHLLPQCTALENVVLPTLAARSADDAVGRAENLLGRVGLEHRMHAPPAQLSGGERQRVAIARALVNSPPLLLCDEPTGNLDQASGETVASLFLELAAERQVMLIIVTHNLEIARRFSRCMELRDGTLVSSQNPVAGPVVGE